MRKTLFLGGLFILFIFFANAQYDFGEYKIIHKSTENGASKLIAADLNGDGQNDLVVINRYAPSSLDWYQNLGNGVFTGEIKIAIQSGLRDVEAADINADGKIDLIACSEWDDRIYWYENDGSGNFSQHLITQSADGVLSIDVADIDGDGDNDVLAVARNNNYVYIFYNDGSGSFTENLIANSESGLTNIDVIDALGNDNHLDFVIGKDNELVIYVNDGSENFYRNVIDNNVAKVNDMAISDIDGDGKQDIAVAAFNNNAVYWYKNNSNVSVSFSKNTVVNNFTQAAVVDIADVDQDGDMDILAGCFYPRKVSLFKNDGSENFSENIVFDNLWSIFSVQAADIVGDSKPEILTASLDDDRVMYFDNPSFEPHYLAQTLAAAYTVLSFDINKDGLNDVLFASRYDHKISYFLNNGNANFSYEYVISANYPLQPMYMVNADFDNDGNQDLVVSGFESNTINIFYGDGNGFQATQYIDIQAFGTMNLGVADFDNNGFTDIVAPLAGVNQVVVYQNNNNSFQKDTIFSYLYGAYITKGVDLNNDNKPEIVAYGQTEQKLMYFKNTSTVGNISFSNPVVIDSLHKISSIAFADADNDGDFDIFATLPDDYLIVVYRNEGNFNFIMDTVFEETGTKPEIIYTTDITDDGDMDLVVLCYDNWAQNAVKVFENKGDGDFNYPSFLGNPYFPDHPNAVTVNDLDNDGDKEIIVGTTWASDMGFFENYALYFIQQPQTAEVCEGDTVFFYVEAYGVEHYQWYKDGQPLNESSIFKGVNSDTLFICGATLDLDNAQFYCVIENDIATNQSRSAQLTVYQFIEANAGNDANVCQNSYVLQGNNPYPGSGLWNILNGSAFFSDQTDPNAELINMSVDTITLTWQITNGLCFSIDTLNLFVDSLVQAITEGKVMVCEQDSVLISASPIDSIYSGTWSIFSGTGNLTDPNNYQTYLTDLQRQENVVLLWTVINGACVSIDTLTVSNDTLVYAYTMNDTVVCSDTMTIYANQPPQGVLGFWNVASGNAIIENPDSNITFVENIGDGVNILAWSLQNGACISSDYLTITKYPTVHIITQPEDLQVNEGAIANFSVEIDGDYALYQWFKDYENAIIDDTIHYFGATSPNLIIAGVSTDDEGYYHCVVSSSTCGSIASDTVYLTVIPGTSVNNSETYLLVYPNPADDKIFIQTNSSETLHFRLIDLNGRVLKETQKISEITEMNINDLNSGYYILEVSSESFIKTIRIVKK